MARVRVFRDVRAAVAFAVTMLALVIAVSDGQAAKPGKPTNTTPPTISGTARAGQTLTASPGSWSGTQPITYSYQWLRCDAGGGNCAIIRGATGKTYTVVSVDVGSTVRVQVTAKNSAGSSSATSAQTAVVGAAPVAPANGSPPTISGAAQAGQTLTASPGTWSGTPPISYSYQWRRCDAAGGSCADILGAAAQTYTLTTSDVGSTLRVAAAASNSAGSSTATSAPTAVADQLQLPVAAV